MAQAKNVPRFTLVVRVHGMPVNRFTIRALTTVVTTAVRNMLFYGTFARDRTRGPMMTMQVTVKNAARLVRTLAEMAALPLPKRKNPLTHLSSFRAHVGSCIVCTTSWSVLVRTVICFDWFV